MLQKRSRKVAFAVAVAVIVISPIAYLSVWYSQPQIKVSNDSFAYYLNYSSCPGSLDPIIMGSFHMKTVINETNHGASSLSMNVTPALFFLSEGCTLKAVIVSNVSFCGSFSSSLHPSGMKLLINSSSVMSGFDSPRPFDPPTASNVTVESYRYNIPQTYICNWVSFENDSRFTFFGHKTPYFHFQYNFEFLKICFAPPFNQSHVFTITLSLLGLQKPVYVEYMLEVVRT
jgi:hypothetical protein